jgi:hypothetical protein
VGRDGLAADPSRVRAWPFVAALVGALGIAGLVGATTTATAGRACLNGANENGYAYAGHQADYSGHGVRATIQLTRAPLLEAGHVAGWVGVGGPGQGANGGDAWIQAGIAAMPGLEPMLYTEITREGRDPEFVLLAEGVQVGRSYRIAVLEMSGRKGWWRVWLDGEPATAPVRLQGSSGRWAPIATAESWNGRSAACNAFGFRFERVSVSYGGGGSWRPFVSGHTFLDEGNQLRDLAAAPAESGVYRRTLAAATPLPYAFAASSSG